jgi:hypothetical protein
MALVILHPQLGKIVVPGVLKALAIRPARPPRSATVPWLRIQGRDPGRPPVLDDEPERDFALDNAGRLVEIAPRGPWPRMRGLVIGWVPALLLEEQWIPVLVIGLSQKVAKCSPASEKAVTRQRYAAAFPRPHSRRRKRSAMRCCYGRKPMRSWCSLRPRRWGPVACSAEARLSRS